MTAKKETVIEPGMTFDRGKGYAIVIGALTTAAATVFSAIVAVNNSGKLDQVHNIVNSTDTALRKQVAELQNTIQTMSSAKTLKVEEELADEKAKYKGD